jgi:competence protein ComEC
VNERKEPLFRPPSLGQLTLAFIAGIVIDQWISNPIPAIWLLAPTFFLLSILLLQSTGFQLPEFRSSLTWMPPNLVFHFPRTWLSASAQRRLLAVLAFLALGAAAGRIGAPTLPAPSSLEPFFDMPQTLFLAEVTSPPDFYPDKVRMPVRLLKAFTDNGTVTVDGGVLLTFRELRTSWFTGDIILARLTLAHFHNFNNPGGYDYVLAQGRRELYGRAYIPDDRLLIKTSQGRRAFPFSLIDRTLQGLEQFRMDSLKLLQTNLNPDTASFYASLLIGYQHLLTKSWQDHLNRVGAMHLLSISGLHLGLVSMATFWFTRRLVRFAHPSILVQTSDQHLALWAALATATLYTLISGFSLPTQRTMVMLILYFGALWRYRSPESLSALAAAALLILLLRPNSLWDISFQFTFAAMLGMLVVLPQLQRFQLPQASVGYLSGVLRLVRPFEYAFWTSIAANATVLPLAAYYFHGVSPAGFVANILLVPLVGFTVLPLGLLGLALFAFSEHAALPVLELGSWFLERSQDLILWFSRFSWSYFWAGAVPVSFLIVYYACLGLVLCSWNWRKKILSIATLILLSWATAAILHSAAAHDNPGNSLHVTAVDVGQGSSTLVRFPSGVTMLVDGGGFYDDSFDIGRNVVAPFLWHEGIGKLDYVVLSHDHPDHRNGLRFILEHFKVGAFWESGITENPGAGELASIAITRGTPIRRLPEIFGEHNIGGCSVRVLHPDSRYIREQWRGKDLNEVSIVVQIRHGNTHLIIPGDITATIEDLLFRDSSPLDSLLLISPHHGSGYSNSMMLMDRLRPLGMIFSCGYKNSLNLPADAVLERCRSRKIPVYRTDLHGAVQAFSDGSQWDIIPSNQAD